MPVYSGKLLGRPEKQQFIALIIFASGQLFFYPQNFRVLLGEMTQPELGGGNEGITGKVGWNGKVLKIKTLSVADDGLW